MGSSGGGNSSPTSQTTTVTQQIPQFEQDFAQANQNIAASLAARPYQNYNAQMIAGFTPTQQQALGQTQQDAYGYSPSLQAAQGFTGMGAQTWGQASPQQQASYMNPYVMNSLAPQLQQLDIQQGQNRNQIAAGATQAGAFGDARHGVEDSLNNFYSGLQRGDIVGQGYNNAYNSGQQAFNTGQQQQLQAGAQFGNLAGAQQQMGLQGNQALFGAGTQEQNLQQQQLNLAYQNFMNQLNYPTQQLNLRTAALTASPYDTTKTLVQPPPNATAQNIGAISSIASLLGGSGSGKVNSNPFGGQTYNGANSSV